MRLFPRLLICGIIIGFLYYLLDRHLTAETIDLDFTVNRDILIAVVGVVVTAILAPAQLRWLWRMSKWIMSRFPIGRREGPAYEHTDSPGDDLLKDRISSLSRIRRIRSPELWVVASGKGGVGKSLLSLGLTEVLSQRGGVLLVDFDLHNRGLTSMLIKDPEIRSTAEAEEAGKHLQETAFSLLGDFCAMLRTSEPESVYKLLLEGVSDLPETFSPFMFNKLASKFACAARLEPGAWGEFDEYDPLTPSLRSFSPPGFRARQGERRGLHRDNVKFLPSRDKTDSFLLSEQSSCSFVVVSLFLQAFCAWIKQSTDAATVILDCHGAHDDLTAGAIIAADKLLVVTTTEPGSYDGTQELLNFLTDYKGEDLPTVVALNNCRSWDHRFSVANSAFQSFEGKLEMRGVIHVPHDIDIRNISGAYKYGDVVRHRMLRDQVTRIVELLQREDRRMETVSTEKRGRASQRRPVGAEGVRQEQSAATGTEVGAGPKDVGEVNGGPEVVGPDESGMSGDMADSKSKT